MTWIKESRLKFPQFFFTIIALSIIFIFVFLFYFNYDFRLINYINNFTRDSGNDILLISDEKLLRRVRNVYKRKSEPALYISLETLKLQASEFITSNTNSVTDDTLIPPSGEIHDYISLAPFYWPVNSNQGNTKYEQLDAQVNPDRIKYVDEDNFYELTNRVYLLSLASYIFDKPQYGKKAKELLAVWFLDEKTKMNPNFNYAQFIPDKNKGTGAGMDAKNLAYILDSITLLKQLSLLTKTDSEKLDQWFADLFEWAKKSEIQLEECKDINNHGTWCDVFYLTLALYNRDYYYANFVIDRTKSRLTEHFTLEGSQPNEINRADSLHYHIFNLEGYVRLAQMAQKIDKDLLHYKTYKGKNIKMGLDFLIPYIKGEKTWQGQQLTDQESKKNLENKIINLYQKAYFYYKDPQYLEILEKFDYAKEENYLNNILYPI